MEMNHHHHIRLLLMHINGGDATAQYVLYYIIVVELAACVLYKEINPPFARVCLQDLQVLRKIFPVF